MRHDNFDVAALGAHEGAAHEIIRDAGLAAEAERHAAGNICGDLEGGQTTSRGSEEDDSLRAHRVCCTAAQSARMG